LGTAAETGYRFRYTLASKLLNELVEAADDTQLSKTIARYGRVDLRCPDELGYMDPRVVMQLSAPIEVRRAAARHLRINNARVHRHSVIYSTRRDSPRLGRSRPAFDICKARADRDAARRRTDSLVINWRPMCAFHQGLRMTVRES
jgi:hypothetical protein